MNEKIHKILELCMKAKAKGHGVAFDYFSTVEGIRIYIYLNGWVKDADYDEGFCFYTDLYDADEKADEIIRYLENLTGGKDGN